MAEAKGFEDRKTGQKQWKGKESGHAYAEDQWIVQKGYGADVDASGKQTDNQWRVLNGVRTQEKERLEDHEKSGWFHICSQGLGGVGLFPDEKAFIVGMNKFATAFKLFCEDVEVVILVLVSTHFHSLAWGRKTDVVRCAERYKKTISMYFPTWLTRLT